VKGITLRVEGDANDYFGKGLSGGRLIVTPPKSSCYKAEKNIIIGNVALYGSTGGEAYINGIAGERFAVRNSAATAVAEGIGDHGCEYMTGGHVVILGPTGRNFGAGMSGGIAFVFDPDQSFEGKFNDSMADLFSVVTDSEDDLELKRIISNHVKYTESEVGTALLTDWDNAVKKFKKVLPRDYARIIEEQAKKVTSQNNMISKEGIGSHG
jgi:glutamate synthase domain-containing protein 3